MSPEELVVVIKAGLDDALDNTDGNIPLFADVDIIADEKPVTIGVMNSEGNRFFVTIEEA